MSERYTRLGEGIATAVVWTCVGLVAFYAKDYNFGWAFLSTVVIWNWR